MNAARAIADLDAGVVLATVDIAAPPERVFRALTTDEVTKWWGSDEMYRTTSFTSDLRVGGKWRSDGKGADGSPFFVEGEYLEIDPPRKLVQTWRPQWEPDLPPTTITYRLEPIDGGTRVTVRHEGFGANRASCDGHSNGWTRVLGWLGGHFAPRDERAFFIRLVPKRPSFMLDMTDAERAVMGAHAAYLRAQLAAGAAIAFGPVADPAGGWGLGILRARDESAVRAIEAKDPAVAELGFHYEVLPMLTLVTRD
jgi:uncharacterized protein YndB with AHSA1/START domain